MANGLPDRYATNQFYGISNAGEPTERTDNDNPLFLWPADHRRNAATGNTYKVQRGYMRLLSEVLGDPADTTSDAAKSIANIGKTRFHFQFNPDTLTRSVAARNDVQMWMNQDPAQFTQPIPGSANFSFEILLNREQEMASGRYNTGNGLSSRRNTAATTIRTVGVNSGATLTSQNAFDLSDATAPSVTDIGVLADLLVFDRIIGQGINRALIDSILNRAEALVTAANLQNQGTQDEEDQDTTPVTFDRNKASDYLSGAIGNSAFLISQPVRVVFSSLFMVEGFITDTTVVFNKFNPAMVPTQCLISVQMQAMYIGFARKDTFLTTVYASAPRTREEVEEENDAKNSALAGIGKNMFGILRESTAVINPEKLLSLGNGTWKVPVVFGDPSTELENFVNEAYGNIIANAVIRIFYITKSAGYSESSGFKTSSTEPIYQRKASEDLKINSAGGEITFEFPTQQADFPKKYDTDSGARYKVEFYIYYTLTSNAGGSVPYSDQFLSIVKNDVTWGTTLPLLRTSPTAAQGSTTSFSSGGVPSAIKDIF